MWKALVWEVKYQFKGQLQLHRFPLPPPLLTAQGIWDGDSAGHSGALIPSLAPHLLHTAISLQMAPAAAPVTFQNWTHCLPPPIITLLLRGWKNLNEDKWFSSSCCPFATIQGRLASLTPAWSPATWTTEPKHQLLSLHHKPSGFRSNKSFNNHFLQADNHFQIYPAPSGYRNTKEVKEEKQEATWFSFPERFQVSQSD